jgi:hypothetical protein
MSIVIIFVLKSAAAVILSRDAALLRGRVLPVPNFPSSQVPSITS